MLDVDAALREQVTPKAAFVACSDPRMPLEKGELDRLAGILGKMGLPVTYSTFLFDGAAPVQERAGELNSYFADSEIKVIFDVSGGNRTNEILPYLDYDVIGQSGAFFCGYSDLSALMGAIYAKTNKASMLYYIRNLTGEAGARQQEEFAEFATENLLSENPSPSGKTDKLCDFDYHFLRGDSLRGILVGGNLRCFLKLAGTPYLPDVTGKVLLLESLGGDLYAIRSMLAQHAQMGSFEKAAGVLLGTFLAAEKNGQGKQIEEAVLSLVPEGKPVAKTGRIGHAPDSKAAWLGRELIL